MFRLYLSHHQALKAQIHTVNEQCIVESPTLTIYRENNNGNMYVTVPMVYNNRLSNRTYLLLSLLLCTIETVTFTKY
jgi:hypothetical protein